MHLKPRTLHLHPRRRTWLVTMTGMRKSSASRLSLAACWPSAACRSVSCSRPNSARARAAIESTTTSLACTSIMVASSACSCCSSSLCAPVRAHEPAQLRVRSACALPRQAPCCDASGRRGDSGRRVRKVHSQPRMARRALAEASTRGVKPRESPCGGRLGPIQTDRGSGAALRRRTEEAGVCTNTALSSASMAPACRKRSGKRASANSARRVAENLLSVSM